MCNRFGNVVSIHNASRPFMWAIKKTKMICFILVIILMILIHIPQFLLECSLDAPKIHTSYYDTLSYFVITMHLLALVPVMAGLADSTCTSSQWLANRKEAIPVFTHPRMISRYARTHVFLVCVTSGYWQKTLNYARHWVREIPSSERYFHAQVIF